MIIHICDCCKKGSKEAGCAFKEEASTIIEICLDCAKIHQATISKLTTAYNEKVLAAKKELAAEIEKLFQEGKA